MTTRKVLITGISGFVGPYLAQRLLSQGNEVTGLVTLRADNKKPKRLVEMGLVSNVQPYIWRYNQSIQSHFSNS